MPFHIYTKKTAFTKSNDHPEYLNALKADLIRATDFNLRLAEPTLQYVFPSNACSHGTWFVLMIEDYLIERKGKTEKTYAPVHFASRLFTAAQLKFSRQCKKCLALYFVLDLFAHFIGGA